MSSGHSHGDIELPIPPGLYEATAELVAKAAIVRGKTIPYLANRSKDGERVYFDEKVPAVLPKTGLKPDDTLPWHELSEWLMQNGWPESNGKDPGYPNPSHYVATAVEKRRVEELGGDWDEYEDEWAGYIKDVDNESMTDIPADIDCRPYVDEHDREVISELVGKSFMEKMMAAIDRLKNLRLDEVSLVDSGANQHAHVALFKRDGGTPNPATDETIDKFIEYLRLIPEEELNKALEAAVQQEITMDAEAIKKAVADEVAKVTAAKDAEHAKELAIAKRELAIAKMSQPHKDYMSEASLSGDALEKYVAGDDVSRDALIKANPVEARLPPSVKKALEDAARDREVLKGLQEQANIAAFAKKATELGLPAAHGETLRKAFVGADADALKKVEELIKSMTAVKETAALFSEFGSKGQSAATPHDEIMAKVTELRKVDPKLTDAQAFTQVYIDPVNADLKKRYDDAEHKRRGILAA